MSKSNRMNLHESRLPDHEQSSLTDELENQQKHSYVASRAYQLWQGRGSPEGSAEDDWLQAERELKSIETAGQSQGTPSSMVASEQTRVPAET